MRVIRVAGGDLGVSRGSGGGVVFCGSEELQEMVQGWQGAAEGSTEAVHRFRKHWLVLQV